MLPRLVRLSPPLQLLRSATVAVATGCAYAFFADSASTVCEPDSGESVQLWESFRPLILPSCRGLAQRTPSDAFGVRIYSRPDEDDLSMKMKAAAEELAVLFKAEATGIADKVKAEVSETGDTVIKQATGILDKVRRLSGSEPHSSDGSIDEGLAAVDAASADGGPSARTLPQRPPVFRAAEAIIPAPIKAVQSFWMKRQLWDSDKTWDVQVLEDYKAHGRKGERLIRVSTTRMPIVSEPRDFILLVKKIPNPPGTPEGSVAYVYTDQGESHPTTGAVRGRIESVLLLVPHTPRSTRVVYAFQVDFAGVLPTLAFEHAADFEAQSLDDFKRFIVSRLHGHA